METAVDAVVIRNSMTCEMTGDVIMFVTSRLMQWSRLVRRWQHVPHITSLPNSRQPGTSYGTSDLSEPINYASPAAHRIDTPRPTMNTGARGPQSPARLERPCPSAAFVSTSPRRRHGIF